MLMELVATSTFGLEAVVRRELESLGAKVIKTEDGKVTYLGDERMVVKSNLWLRCADRVYIKAGEFRAESFEELFQQVKAIPWENYIPADGAFPVTGTSVKSTLHSVPSCQSIIKKAIVSHLSEVYLIEHFDESAAVYKVRFSILKDVVTVLIDTSGAGLHKRGYRVKDVEAPIKETLAAALVKLSFWRGGTVPPRMLVDPCCGSGTILIEAALMARGIAPGLGRSFASEQWPMIPANIWKEERTKAYDSIDHDRELLIKGFDIDKKAIDACKANAVEAGVDGDISFSKMDMRKFRGDEHNGIIITNPPYGERIGDPGKSAAIYEKLASICAKDPTWSVFVITTDKDLEKNYFHRKADRRRKLYNGRLETTYYQFYGKKPIE
jgi:putative N6-adenine-specific DNA methylase